MLDHQTNPQALLEKDHYFDRLLKTLFTFVEGLEKGTADYFDLPKAVFLAEFVNNQFDSYLKEFWNQRDPDSDNSFLKSDAFINRWRELKNQRDQIYKRLVVYQQKVGEEAVMKATTQYSSMVTRYAFPRQ